MTNHPPSKLRLGIICQSLEWSSWEARVVETALENENNKLALFILPSQSKPVQEKSLNERSGRRRSILLLKFYNKILWNRCYGRRDVSSQYKEVGRVEYPVCLDIDGTARPNDEVLREIKKEDLDILIYFSGFARVPKGILESARYGVWAFRHRYPKEPGECPPFFWELYNKIRAIRVVLQRYMETENEVAILREATYKAITHSYKNNLAYIQNKTGSWIKGVCADIFAGRAQNLNAGTERWEARPAPPPSNRQVLKFCFMSFKSRVLKVLRGLFQIEQWNIGLINKPIEELIEGETPPNVQWLLAPSKKEFFADPFPIRTDRLYVLFENYNQVLNKGTISAISLRAEDSQRQISNSLDKAHHLSYPHVFRHDNDVYLVVEECVTNEVALYRSRGFPTQWERVAVLEKNIAAVDATLFQHAGFWWLFYILKEDECSTTLYILYSQKLEGPWLPHGKNPVKSHIVNTRPAGKVFTYRDSLVRPTQDCSESYGGKIVLNKILELSPGEFKEEPLKIISPNKDDKYNKGIHTINGIEDIVIVDGKRYVFSLINLKRQFRRRLPRSASADGKFGPFQIINRPKPTGINAYQSALQKATRAMKEIPGIAAIYQLGGFSHPGISDIDLLVIFNDEARIYARPQESLRKINRYLFTHNISAISKTHFQQADKYSVWYKPRLLWGEDLRRGEDRLGPADREAIEKQTALEFLIENYIDLTIQLKYGVIKLRGTLQHLKAIRLDLNLLGKSSGPVFEMVELLLSWLDKWFENRIPESYFWNWIKEFHSELETLLNEELRSNPLYIPPGAFLRFGRNIHIRSGAFVANRHSGFSMHPYLVGSHKKVFNLNMRLNSFRFEFPSTSVARRSILEERIEFYKKIKEHGLDSYPFFDPFVPGFSYKIIPSPKGVS